MRGFFGPINTDTTSKSGERHGRKMALANSGVLGL
jgi:hypothetical protein